MAQRAGIGGIDSLTKLMLNLDSDYTDSSLSPKTVTNTNYSINTSIKKFGAGSLAVATTGQLAYDSDVIPTGALSDISIDFWLYVPSAVTISASHQLVFQQALGTVNKRAGDFHLRIMKTSSLLSEFTGSAYAMKMAFFSLGFDNLTKDAWHHIYMYTDGTSGIMGIDGTITSVTSSTDTTSFSTADYTRRISTVSSLGGIYLDEVRISNAKRWDANFTPSSEPYST